jgi:hypothetical protein
MTMQRVLVRVVLATALITIAALGAALALVIDTFRHYGLEPRQVRQQPLDD